jgi:hypothetical protein
MFLSWLRTQTRHAMRKAQRTSKPAGRRATFRPRLEALEGRDVPSTLTVTNTLDSGTGSLRAEIAAAHQHPGQRRRLAAGRDRRRPGRRHHRLQQQHREWGGQLLRRHVSHHHADQL